MVGATATGKTALAEAMAHALDAAVVCCDSRQVFRELEIGTGKPSPSERATRPHHLFDALDLGQLPSAGWYARVAAQAREEVRSRGQLPLLVGGSGLYLRAASEGLAAEPPHDAGVRARVRAELEAEGPEALHRRLARLDPVTAARLAPGDRQRVARALEVAVASGKPLSWWHTHAAAAPGGESWVVIELVEDPARLRARIGERTRWMLDHGLVEETRALIAAGWGGRLRALRAIGYDEVVAMLDGGMTRELAETRINLRTAQLAKRQRTWFRRQVSATRLDATLGEQELRSRALAAISGAGHGR